MVYAAGSEIGHVESEDRRRTVIKNFGSAYADCKFGPWEGSPPEDGDMRGDHLQRGRLRLQDLDRQEVPGHRGIVRRRLDNVRISPKGTYIIWAVRARQRGGHRSERHQGHRRSGQLRQPFRRHRSTRWRRVWSVGSIRVRWAKARVAAVALSDERRHANGAQFRRLVLSYIVAGQLTHAYAVRAPTDESGGNPPYNGELI